MASDITTGNPKCIVKVGRLPVFDGFVLQMESKIAPPRMPNGTYGGVGGR